MKYIQYNMFIFSPLLQNSENIKLTVHLPSYSLIIQDANHVHMTNIIMLILNTFIYYFILSDLVHSNNFDSVILTARGPPLEEV